METPPVYLHIGLFKTGTSFLQATVFPQLQGVTYYASDSEWLKYIWDMNSRSPFDLADWECPVVPDKGIIISREDLMGSPFHNYSNGGQILNKLANDLRGARVLVTLRRQDDYVESLYRQHIQTGGVQSVNRFLNFYDGEYGEFTFKNGVTLDVKELDYLKVVKSLEQTFGRDNITLIPYELMVRDKARFYGLLAQWLNRDSIPWEGFEQSGSVNKSISLPGIYLSRFLNRFIGGSEMSGFGLIPEMPGRKWLLHKHENHKWAGALLILSSKISVRTLVQGGFDKLFYRKGKAVSEKHREAIMAMHADSNRQLDEQYNLGLKRLGYY